MARGGGALAVVATVVGLVVAVATATSAADGKPANGARRFSCAVGKPPAHELGPNLAGGLRISDELVVACGQFGRQPVAVVGYVEHFRGHRQTCFNLERPGSSVGIACRREGEPWYSELCPDFCLIAYPADATESHRALRTLVVAVVPPGTARVTVKAGAGDRARTVAALVVPVEGAMLEAFGEEQPVILAAAVVGGCYRAPGVRLVAIDANGVVLSRARGQLSFPGQCRIPNFPPPPEASARSRLR